MRAHALPTAVFALSNNPALLEVVERPLLNLPSWRKTTSPVLHSTWGARRVGPNAREIYLYIFTCRLKRIPFAQEAAAKDFVPLLHLSLLSPAPLTFHVFSFSLSLSLPPSFILLSAERVRNCLKKSAIFFLQMWVYYLEQHIVSFSFFFKAINEIFW